MKHPERWQQRRFLRDAKGRLQGPHMERWIARAYEPVIRTHARGRLADMGCGEVPYHAWYKDHITGSVCVDWPQSLHAADHVDLHADLNTPIPAMADASFDTVLCTDVLEHLHSPDVLWHEMARILKPGGHLIVGVPFLYWVHEAPHDHHRYTAYKLKHWCAQYGLQVVHLEAYGGWPEVVFDTVDKGLLFWKPPGWRLWTTLWHGLGHLLSRFPFVRRLSQRSRDTFPLGYVLVACKH